MKLLNKQKNKICFESDINQSLVNSLRRYVNEIKIIAVDEVEISKNDGPLYDETVAHRIGLIPLKMEKSFKENDEKKLKLKSKKHGFVLSKELKGDVEVIHDEMPITLLNEDQELALTAKVRMGRGKDHSKFSPGLIFYRNVCEMELDKKFSGEISKRFNNKIKEKGNK